MKMTIGMAAVDNYSQVYSTIQDIRRNNDCSNVEFVLVNNKPSAKSSIRMKRFIEGWVHARGNLGAKYVEIASPTGTAIGKQAVFDNASNDLITVMDSHVWLPAGWVQRLFKFYSRVGNSKNLFTSPLVWDDLGLGTLKVGTTHFDPYWRSEMWGIWGKAWKCPCRPAEVSDGTIFSMNGVPVYGEKITFYEMSDEKLTPFRQCEKCGRAVPTIANPAKYMIDLKREGYHELGASREHAPFEIPGMGMGFFSCWRHAWPGFNRDFRGFGGEELYIHRKLRMQGGKTYCLPELGPWTHEFADAKTEPTKYVVSHWDKMRNYVVGFTELGLPLDEIYEHFVDGYKVTDEEWEFLVSDPKNHVEMPDKNKRVAFLNSQPPKRMVTAEEIYRWVVAQPRDLTHHMPTIRKYAKGNVVVEITDTRETTVALVAGEPNVLVSYTTCEEPVLLRMPASDSHMRMSYLPEETFLGDDIDVVLINDPRHKQSGDLIREATFKRAMIVGNIKHGHTIDAIGDRLRRQPELAVVEVSALGLGLVVLADPRVAGLPAQPAPLWKPTIGPGKNLMTILSSIGVTSKPGCDCKAKAGLMDVWGAKGCRIHYDTILKWLVEGQTRWTWAEKLKAAAVAVSIGLAFKLDPLNPIKSVLDLAIAQAEKE